MVGKLCEEVLPHHSEWKNCPYCLKDEKGLSEHPDPVSEDFRWFQLLPTASMARSAAERST